MNEPLEPTTVKIETLDQLQKLYGRGYISLTSLEVGPEAVNFQVLAEIISKNCLSLKALRICSPKNKKDITHASFESFTFALQKCFQLTSLALVGFQAHLDNPLSSSLPHVLYKLIKLQSLDLSGTYLSWWGQEFFIFLGGNCSIKELNLNHALDDSLWGNFLAELAHNSTLERIILGDSPIDLRAVKGFIEVITLSTSAIKEIVWSPKKFYDNVIDKLIIFYSSFSREHEQKGDLFLSRCHQLDAYKQTGEHPSLEYYDWACGLLEQLQDFLKEKRTQRPKMCLELEFPNEKLMNWNLVAGYISLHGEVLQYVHLRMQNQEVMAPLLFHDDKPRFLTALSKCSRLRSLKIEVFQEAFMGRTCIADLLNVLQKLPLGVLSFNRTYLGPLGFEYLLPILRNGKLIEIDLTLSGIICDLSVATLAKGISGCPTLQKITLGRSPLTIPWWQALSKAVEQHKKQPVLDWQFTCEDEMSTKMEVMTQNVAPLSYRPKDDPELLRAIFCRQIVGIEQQWEALQNQPQPQPNNGIFNFFGSREVKNNSGQEMTTFTAKEDAPLLQNAPKTTTSYGATGSSKNA